MDRRVTLAAVVLVGLVAACSDDVPSPTAATSSPAPDPTTPTTITPTTITPTTITPTTTTPTPTTTTTSTAPDTTAPTATVTTTTATGPSQPAVWPAPGAGFDSPEEVAADFIEHVIGVEALLGDFMPGDAMSGEIEVLSPLDDEDPATTAPTGVVLLLRRLPPDGDWFVLAAASEGITIDSPVAHSDVAAGPVEVSGSGRGFEGTVVVRAFLAGDESDDLDLQIAATDWQFPVPYAVTLDLGETRPGDVVTILARGDTGITAAGEFAAIPVVVAG